MVEFVRVNQISMEQGYTGEIHLKSLKRVDISTIDIISKKVHGNNMDFLTSKITPIKVRPNNVDFLAMKITSKKICGNNLDFPTSEITSKKVRGNNVDFFDQQNYIEKSLWKQRCFFDQRNYIKKYLEMTWNFVEICSSTYWRNIDVESTWIRRGMPIGWRYGEECMVFERQYGHNMLYFQSY